MTLARSRGVDRRTPLLAVLLAILGITVPTLAAPKPRPQALPRLEDQVLLDRAHFSPGLIDGKGGPNTDHALAAFQKSGNALERGSVDPLIAYTIAPGDVAGPFEVIPEDMMEKSKLKALTYATPLEALSEKFHASPALLTQLNPHAQFAAGDVIRVPNVLGAAALAPVAGAIVTVAKAASSLTVSDATGHTIFYAPVTTGSEHDPLPIGDWAVTAVVRNPTFNYNPDLFWDADPAHAKAKIPAGPNSPVGVVWVDITKPHYGIHGTPEPQTVGKTASHGCVRLTNWDATTLASLVAKGTKVVFTE